MQWDTTGRDCSGNAIVNGAVLKILKENKVQKHSLCYPVATHFLLLAAFTFMLSYSWSPRDEEIPRRSRPVSSVLLWDTIGIIPLNDVAAE